MKKTIFFLALLLITSCSKDASDPIDENENEKGHDNWSKVSFIFTEGKTTSEGFKGYKDNQDITFKTVQKYSFEYKNGQVEKTGDTIKLIKGKSYGLEIRYYNGKELMNYQFATPEMAPIHQHYFIPSSDKENTITYEYRDTNPVDKMIGEANVSLRDENDPIGLKGYFDVTASPKIFDLKVILVHIIAGTKQDDNGNPYPFYAPSARVLGTTDFNKKIPMKIFTDTNSENYIKDIAKEYNITERITEKELSTRTLGNLSI